MHWHGTGHTETADRVVGFLLFAAVAVAVGAAAVRVSIRSSNSKHHKTVATTANMFLLCLFMQLIDAVTRC